MGRAWVAWAAACVVGSSLVACGSSERSGGGTVVADGGTGAGGDGPSTSNSYVDQVRQTVADKVDLLLVLDNSAGMADKQRLLAEAVPLLVQRLITPPCVDDDGNPTGGNSDADGGCANGRAQFSPVKDMPGFCYINAAPNEPNVGDPELVAACTAGAKRLLRFVEAPAPDSSVFVACAGSLGEREGNR